MRGREGFKVIDADWDYLIVLDACRFDVFKEVNNIEGVLKPKRSLGSVTTDWVKNNFRGNSEEIIYISGNPFVSDHEFDGFRASDHFSKVVNVWKTDWDKDLETIPPEKITEAALREVERNPNKRMIIHYMQPHGPWIGDTNLSCKEQVKSNRSTINPFNNDEYFSLVKRVREELVFGGLSLKKFKRAYRDNLIHVLDDIEKLINSLDGKVVVTSDHGTLHGEWGLYFHSRFIRFKQLIVVPWLEVDRN